MIDQDEATRGYRVRVRFVFRVRVGVRVGVRCFVVTRRHKGVLCVQQHCGRRRQRSSIWAATERESVQHADGDAGWRLGLGSKPELRTPVGLGLGLGLG